MHKQYCNCNDLERTIKNIYVFVNGAKYSGQKVVLSQNRWHHILNQITCKLDPYFGKVEKLYTTSSGLSIYSFTDLTNNAVYVASNKVKKFHSVKGGYTFETEASQEYFEHYLSSQLERVNKHKKLVYVRRDLLVIYIFRNGECRQSFKIVLTNDDLSSWNHILSYIALILDVPERCIKSLYSVSGNKICGPWELQHGASYVAVGYNECFKKGCYQASQKTAEVLLSGYPVVPIDKSLACTHKVRRKMKPYLKWYHYDQVDCAPLKKKPKCTRSCRNKSNMQVHRVEGQAQPSRAEQKLTPTSTAGSGSGKGKKVTVHMRIKNPEASNVTITRNSGDSYPSSSNKKNWDGTPDSSEIDEQDYSSRICPKSSRKKLKKTGSASSAGSSASKTSSCRSCKIKGSKQKNLTWKHVQKKESDTDDGKVTVKVKGGKGIVLSGSSSQSILSKATDQAKDTCTSILKKILEKKNFDHKAKLTDCSKTCKEKKKCKKYRLSKPKDKSSSFINLGSPSPCSSRTRSITESIKSSGAKLFRRVKTFLTEPISSADSMKGCTASMSRRCDSDSEGSASSRRSKDRKDRGKCGSTAKRPKSKKMNKNNSQCTICRIQHEYKRINKGL